MRNWSAMDLDVTIMCFVMRKSLMGRSVGDLIMLHLTASWQIVRSPPEHLDRQHQ